MALERIWLKRSRRAPMVARRRVRMLTGLGLEGNVEQGGRRQVTILSADKWREIESRLETRLDPAVRRANLLVSGVELEGSGGQILRIGQARIRIGGESRGCRRMDQAHPGLLEAMGHGWGGGVYGQVVDGAEIEIGDPVAWDNDASGASGT